MDLNVKIEGLDRLERSSARVRESVAKEVQAGLYLAAKKIEGDAKRSVLGGKKTGRTYRRRAVLHRASAPGEAPASDTGRLVNSIVGELTRTAGEAVVRAGNGVVKYARLLEFGTLRMAARPFFFPAVEQNRKWVIDRLKQAVAKGIQRGTRG